MSKLLSRIFFVVNASRWRGGVTEECWIRQKEEKEEWKDEEEVNEESDASGRLFLAPDVQTEAHTYTHIRADAHKTKHYGKTTVKAVNLYLSLSTGQQHRKAASLTHLNMVLNI